MIDKLIDIGKLNHNFHPKNNVCVSQLRQYEHVHYAVYHGIQLRHFRRNVQMREIHFIGFICNNTIILQLFEFQIGYQTSTHTSRHNHSSVIQFVS